MAPIRRLFVEIRTIDLSLLENTTCKGDTADTADTTKWQTMRHRLVSLLVSKHRLCNDSTACKCNWREYILATLKDKNKIPRHLANWTGYKAEILFCTSRGPNKRKGRRK
mmetsp:Transcript_40044/g.59384  ORF Transcript_40044/g.59384 Transcript_40044/m.59384 type:complete len:110 (+) Transcript_40044:77-406(+)